MVRSGVARGLEFRQSAGEALEVDRLRLVHLRVPRESVSSEVIGIVLDHPLEFVFVEPRVPRATAASRTPTVLLPATMGPAPPQFPRPGDHLRPPRPASARGDR